MFRRGIRHTSTWYQIPGTRYQGTRYQGCIRRHDFLLFSEAATAPQHCPTPQQHNNSSSATHINRAAGSRLRVSYGVLSMYGIVCLQDLAAQSGSLTWYLVCLTSCLGKKRTDVKSHTNTCPPPFQFATRPNARFQVTPILKGKPCSLVEYVIDTRPAKPPTDIHGLTSRTVQHVGGWSVVCPE